MLSFKEYTLLSFQNIVEERVRNFLLGHITEPALLYNLFNYSEEFLNSLTSEEAIKFFVEENNKMAFNTGEGKKDLFSLFENTLQKNKKYYDLVFYYLKENGLPTGISPIDQGVSKQENSQIAAREIFANEIYKFSKLINLNVSNQLNEQFKSVAPQKNIFTKEIFSTKTTNKRGQPWVYKINGENKTVLQTPYGDIQESMFAAVNEMEDIIDQNLISLIDNAWGI